MALTIADITVRGAGIFGLSVAWTCVQRGARVQIVDPHGPGAGSSGGIVGALAPHVPERWNPIKQFQLDGMLMMPAFWQSVEAAGGLSSGYARTGRLQSIPDARALSLAHERSLGADTLWPEDVTWNVIDSSDAPWEPFSPTGKLIHDTLSARIHPRRACAALAAALQSKGITVQSEAPDQGQVLWATGVQGLHDMTKERGLLAGAGMKGQAALLKYDARDLPHIFSDALHIIPHQDGTVGVGSTSELVYEKPYETDEMLDEIIARTRLALPVLADAPVLERWSNERPRSRSRAPMIGVWPDRPGHFVANGGFKIGFGIAPKVGQVMVDLMLEGIDAVPKGFSVNDSLYR